MKRLLLLTVLLLTVAGCGAVGTMTEGFKHSQEVADDLGKATGSKPFVGFNWNNGSLTNVTVTFDGIPAGRTTEEIAALSRSSIRARFKQEPRNIVIGFRLPGKNQ
ncbi:MAG TPA: hypothetical protein VGW12_15215 [Pyrinomonadaceae bacterium]|nr:hypothetical protein [Pyrinomonadaceae bacterium]